MYQNEVNPKPSYWQIELSWGEKKTILTCLCSQNEMEFKDMQHALRKDRFARIFLGLIKGESF